MTHPLTDIIPPLKVADRCDVGGCGAQAFFAVLLTVDNDEPLRFCGHHAKANLDAILSAKPFAVRDEIAVLPTPAEV